MAILKPGTVAKSTTGKVTSEHVGYSKHCLDDEQECCTLSYQPVIHSVYVFKLIVFSINRGKVLKMKC